MNLLPEFYQIMNFDAITPIEEQIAKLHPNDQELFRLYMEQDHKPIFTYRNTRSFTLLEKAKKAIIRHSFFSGQIIRWADYIYLPANLTLWRNMIPEDRKEFLYHAMVFPPTILPHAISSIEHSF